MSNTDTSEKGLETLIVRHMTGTDGLAITPGAVLEKPDAGSGYFGGSPKDYDRTQALDVPQLFAFLRDTQPEAFKKLAIVDEDAKDINRLKFLTRLSNEVRKRGVIDVLRKGVDHGPVHSDLFYGTPSPGNAKAEGLHAQNRFSITRQLAYSMDEARRALDLCLFINGLYTPEQVKQVVELFLGGAEREKLDPILDACVAVYVNRLDEDGQVEFKGKAKLFCRTYSFLSSVIPYNNAEWEKLSILLDLLTPKLPAPQEEDLSKGILEAIDMDSYRVEKKAAVKIALADKDAEIEPVPTNAAGRKSEPELDRLSNILKTFNEHFGTLFTDADRVAKRIRDDIAPKVGADVAYQNAKENTPHTARMAHDQALSKVMQRLLKDDTKVYKEFVENESFKRFVADMVYALTNQGPSAGSMGAQGGGNM